MKCQPVRSPKAAQSTNASPRHGTATTHHRRRSTDSDLERSISEPLFLGLPGKLVQSPVINAREQAPVVGMIIERRGGRRQFAQTATQCFVYNRLKCQISFPRDLRQTVGQIVFESQRCSHIDIMMSSSVDVKTFPPAVQPSPRHVPLAHGGSRGHFQHRRYFFVRHPRDDSQLCPLGHPRVHKLQLPPCRLPTEPSVIVHSVSLCSGRAGVRQPRWPGLMQFQELSSPDAQARNLVPCSGRLIVNVDYGNPTESFPACLRTVKPCAFRRNLTTPTPYSKETETKKSLTSNHFFNTIPLSRSW